MAACVALAASAADRRETRPVSGFTRIALAAPIKVELTQGDTESLVLEGDESALAEIETVVEHGTLKIRTKSEFDGRSGMVEGARLRDHATSKRSRSRAPATSPRRRCAAPTLKIAISGSGDVRIAELRRPTLDVSVSGSGDVTVAGKADEVSTSIAGSGDVRAGKLESRARRRSRSRARATPRCGPRSRSR